MENAEIWRIRIAIQTAGSPDALEKFFRGLDEKARAMFDASYRAKLAKLKAKPRR